MLKGRDAAQRDLTGGIKSKEHCEFQQRHLQSPAAERDQWGIRIEWLPTSFSGSDVGGLMTISECLCFDKG